MDESACVPHRYHGICDTFLHSLSIMYLFVSNLLLYIYIYIYIIYIYIIYVFIFDSFHIKMAGIEKTLAKLAEENNIAEVGQRLAQGANIDEQDANDV